MQIPPNPIRVKEWTVERHRLALRGSVCGGTFLRLRTENKVPDRSSGCRNVKPTTTRRSRKVFGDWPWSPGADLVKGEQIGVDHSTIEANAALRTFVRRGERPIAKY